MFEDYQQLLADATSATDKAESVRILAKILAGQDGKDFVTRLDPKDGEMCIEILDHGLSERKISKAEKQTFSVMLWKLAASHKRLPDSVAMQEELEISEEIRAGGESTDIRVGKHKGNLVAVTARAISPKNNPDWIRQGFCKQVILWSKLSHPNVLKLLGAYGDMEKGPLTTVSEWVSGGDIMEYTKHNPANRLALLHGAAQGLKYLHDEGIVHGDPTGQSILVKNDAPRPSTAYLSGFACMTVTLDPGEPIPFDVQLGHGTVQFKAPERFNPEKFGAAYPLVTPEADVYAFGMTIFQVLTGETPFQDLQEVEVIDSVVDGLRPAKPQNASAIGFSDSLWDFAQRCWNGDRTRRPTTTELAKRLNEAATNWHTLMPPNTTTPPGTPPLVGPSPTVSGSTGDESDPTNRPEARESHLGSVDAPPDIQSSTAGPERANGRNALTSLLRRLGNAFRAASTALRTVVACGTGEHLSN